MKTRRLIFTLGILAPGVVAVAMAGCSAGDTSAPRGGTGGGASGSNGSGGTNSGSGGDNSGSGGDNSGSGGTSSGSGGDSSGSGGSTGSGGTTSGSGGSTGTGGGGIRPGCTPDSTAAVQPAGDDLDLIDTGDTKWWMQASAGGTYTPDKTKNPPAPTMDDTRTVLHITGTGLGQNDYGTLDFSPTPGAMGGEPTDLSGTTGISFDAKGDPGNYWVIVGTADTGDRFCKCAVANCGVGYRFQVTTASTTAWTPVTVKWTDFALPTWLTPQAPFDAHSVYVISFGGIGTATSFDVAVDNLKLTH
jgi:hypothetical protein